MIRTRFLPLALLGATLASGCARRIPETEPADIPRLEAAVQANPYDPEALTYLGVAQYRARRLTEAAEILGRAVATGEAPGAAYLYLGLTREDQEDWSGARDAYLAYIERGSSDSLKQEIQDRLTLILRQEFRAQAREVVAREEELSGQAPTVGTVAVLPFRLLTEGDELIPLQVALADMMTTDLALSGGLTVLERAQVQSLLREMALEEGGYASPETGARAGRMLRTAHIVQGTLASLPEDTLRFDTDVVDVGRGASAGDATAQRPLEHLFDMEKEAVFRILDILGVETTAAEREAIGQNRAENLLAFLAYGRGLLAMDEGEFGQAQEYFREAIQADPGFDAAQEASLGAASLIRTSEVTPFQISSMAGLELSAFAGGLPTAGLSVMTTGASTLSSNILETVTEGVVPNAAGLVVDLGSVLIGADPQSLIRNPVQEVKGQEGITSPGLVSVRITITLPGGGD
jgi:tetratricopeptide (TPR) repeat protein